MSTHTTQDEALLISPCFVALTRPATLMGVTVDYWMLNLLISSSIAIGVSFLYLPFVSLTLHVMGVIAYKIDPYIFALLEGRLQCARCPNKRLWGCMTVEGW